MQETNEVGYTKLKLVFEHSLVNFSKQKPETIEIKYNISMLNIIVVFRFWFRTRLSKQDKFKNVI